MGKSQKDTAAPDVNETATTDPAVASDGQGATHGDQGAASDSEAQESAPQERGLGEQAEFDISTVIGGAIERRGNAARPTSDGKTGTQAVVEYTERGLAAITSLNALLEQHATMTLSPEAAVADIIAQIMSAATVDEVLADVEAKGWDELLDVPVRLHAVKFNQSTYEQGLPWYAVADIERLDNGWRGAVTTGAQSVMAQLMMFVRMGALPTICKLVYATKNPTPNGNRPVRLARV